MLSYLRIALTLALLALTAPAFAQAYCPAGTPHSRLITTTSYTIGQTDACKVLVFTSAAAVAVTLPAPGTAGGFLLGNGFHLWVFAEGGGTVTTTPAAPFSGTTPTINGASSLALGGGKSYLLTIGTDNNYYASGAGTPTTMLENLNIKLAGDLVTLSLR